VTAVAAPPVSPFKGLAAFADSDLDAFFFFGREREREVVVANMLASRLTVLYGESGVGKSSLLAAGVVRALRVQAPEAVVRLHDTWSGPTDDVLREIADAPEAYLILDQFEEYFLYHCDDASRGGLLHDLPELLRLSRVNVLLSLREDSIARLDAFKARIPAVFANQLRLEHLDRNEARSAILGPLNRWNELTGERVEIEPELVEAVLDDVTRDGGRVEAPYLQLVLERIWNAESDGGPHSLRLATFRRLGGAGTIVGNHLEGALESLDRDEQDVAASMFEHLVTPSGTKIAHRVPDLAQYAHVPEDGLRRVLATLTRERIVHSVDGSDRFEIFHDVLAEPIRDWRLRRRVERERLAALRRQRRLYALVGLALLALVVVAGVAVWAMSERGKAQGQARHAQAGELEALALQRLTVDPHDSVRLALKGARRESSRGAEEILRQTLVVDRLRLTRHTDGPVRDVAVSPRGDLIAAAVAPGAVLLLDARNRRLVRTLGPRGHVAEVAFGPDGRTVVTASPTGVARVWDVASGRPVEIRLAAAARRPDGGLAVVPLAGRLRQTMPHVRKLSVSPKGDRIAAAVAQPDGRVRPWIFARDGRLLGVLPMKRIQDLTFSPDGHLLAIAAKKARTALWDANTGKLVRWFKGEATSGARAVAFSPDGSLLASGGEDSGVRIWTVATGERTYFLFGHSNPVSKVVWSPDGRVVASASPDGTVKLWRVHGIVGAGSLAATLAGDAAPVRALAFAPSSGVLVTGGDGRTVRVWDARPDQQLALLGRAAGAAVAALWAGKTIVGGWSSGVVKTFDAATRQLTHVLRRSHGGVVSSLAASADASVIAAAGGRGGTDVWNGATGAQLSNDPDPALVRAVAVAPRGDLVASGDSRGVVRVFRASDGTLMWSRRQRGPVTALAFSPNGARLASSGSVGTVLRSSHDGSGPQGLSSPKGDVTVEFSPDGRLVATAGVDGNGRLWFAGTGKLYRVLRGHKRALTDIDFSRDGRLVATAGSDSNGRIWSVATGIGHVLQRVAFGPLRSISLDASGKWVAAADPISAIVWSAVSGQQLFYLRGHTGLMTAVSFSPSGATVLSANRDGTLRTYDCDVCLGLSGLVHLAEVRLARAR
jgi:WD40 repeat protein